MPSPLIRLNKGGDYMQNMEFDLIPGYKKLSKETIDVLTKDIKEIKQSTNISISEGIILEGGGIILLGNFNNSAKVIVKTPKPEKDYEDIIQKFSIEIQDMIRKIQSEKELNKAHLKKLLRYTKNSDIDIQNHILIEKVNKLLHLEKLDKKFKKFKKNLNNLCECLMEDFNDFDLFIKKDIKQQLTSLIILSDEKIHSLS